MQCGTAENLEQSISGHFLENISIWCRDMYQSNFRNHPFFFVLCSILRSFVPKLLLPEPHTTPFMSNTEDTQYPQSKSSDSIGFQYLGSNAHPKSITVTRGWNEPLLITAMCSTWEESAASKLHVSPNRNQSYWEGTK